MPESVLWTQHVGMEALNSVGSTGSCDSMESISSNHSAFSGDSYDHLSAEERECLMFLEETIDSLENEADSGLSNDEFEIGEKSPSLPNTDTMKIPPASSDGKTPHKVPGQPKVEEKTDVHRTVELDLNKITLPKQTYYSFPRIVQVSKEEIPKNSVETGLPDPQSDPGKALYGKPKSLTSINQKNIEEIAFPDLHLLPPPEPFRDPKIDKRRSVNDPTDAREVQFGKSFAKFPYITEYKEVATASEHSHTMVMPTAIERIPRAFSPQRIPHTVNTGSQEALHFTDKTVDSNFKQGPPTAPKPRKLPPHIMIKPSVGGGVASNIETSPRPRAFSAHERNSEKNTESINAKLSQSKEQESARREALQKLGLLQEKSLPSVTVPVKSSVFPRYVETPIPQGVMEHAKKDAYGKSVTIKQQEKADILSTSPNQQSVLDVHRRTPSSDNVTSNKTIVKNRLNMKSSSLEKSDDPGEVGGALPPNEVHVLHDSPRRSAKSEDINRVRHSLKTKENEKSLQPTHALKEFHTVIDATSSQIKHFIIENPTSIKTDEVVFRPTAIPRVSHPVTDVSKKDKHDINSNVTNTKEASDVVDQPKHPAIIQSHDHVSKADTLQDNKAKVGSLENISMMSTSPGKRFSFPRPKEVSIPKTSPEVTLREGKGKAVVDKSNRHSSHMDIPSEQFLRLPQGSVPGLRQINIKSNTLERSGVGLGNSIASGENQTQKSGNSIFKKPLFSANFLRNSRPRPASLGTGKDFAAMEEPPTDTEKNEGRRSFFSRSSRPSPPVTSVKITPKGSTDEHRREALLKLGILKE
ncbi:specifically androgen-regulated gene protein [Discoglossus pictus]